MNWTARIQKSSGAMEEFDRHKLEESLIRAGATTDVAKRVSSRITPMDGQSSRELRKAVAEELRRENQAVSAAYVATKRLNVRASAATSAGVIRAHDELLKSLGLESGKTVRLSLEGKEARLRIEKASEGRANEIHLSKEDFERLGAREDARLSVRFER